MSDKEYRNGRCCVFQPFDGDVFDKRFDDTLAPAIESAGLEPYRVDRDLGSVIPIDTLHAEIKSAAVCIADITTRNPNVMYELGYAVAAGKDVVIVCGPTLEKSYPFDIQHRGIIRYSTGSRTDFDKFGSAVTERLSATLDRQKKNDEVVSLSPMKLSSGLEPHEVTALALILANTDSLDDWVPTSSIRQEMKKANFNDQGVRLALARLVQMEFVESKWREDDYDQKFIAYSLTTKGQTWLLDNQFRLELTITPHSNSTSTANNFDDSGITDEDIPF